MKKLIALAACIVTVFNILAQGEINVTIEEVKSDQGFVYVNLYSSENGFPSEWPKAFRQEKLKASEGTLMCSFLDLPYGFYAISVGHDKNENGELDSNFIGFPKEPVGASNQTSFGKPSFKNSKFELKEGNSKKEIRIGFLNE